MKTLLLPIKRFFFDMILDGIKPHEYRAIKPHWVNRVTWHEFHKEVSCYNSLLDAIARDAERGWLSSGVIRQDFDTVTLRVGYSKHAPTAVIDFKGITYGEGNPEWGAVPGEKYFVIKLGEILKTENI